MTEKKVALFLGSGASVPFGKPTTVQLRSKLLKKYDSFGGSNVTQSRFLYSMLSFSKFEDIEHVLQSIKETEEFLDDDNYGGNYFLNNEVYFHFGNMQPHLGNLKRDIAYIQKTLEDDVFENYAWNYDAENDLISIYDQVFALLKKYSSETRIFTTNYDSAIEEYCSKKKLRCIDGFKFDEYSGRKLWTGDFGYTGEEGSKNVYLYKLHGSLNWKKHKTYGIEKTSEERRTTDANYTDNLVIYPTVSPKDGAEIEPYKSIRTEFEKFMDTADICIVIGFSFRDDHINEIFLKFLKKGKPFIVISPSADINFYENLLGMTLEKPSPNSSYDSVIQKEGIHAGFVTKSVSTETIAEVTKNIESLIGKWNSESQAHS